ncbi:MAG: sensor histidine kinase [Anaerolineae bacterium]
MNDVSGTPNAGNSRDAPGAPDFGSIVAELPIGIALVDGDHRVTYMNDRARDLLPLVAEVGGDGLLTTIGGLAIGDISDPACRPDWYQLALGDPPARAFEVGCRSLEPSAAGCVLLVREVTRERDARAQLRQQERLAALGQLAGGVAHDFNNILQAIIGFSEVLARRDDLPDDARRRFETIAEQGRRGAELVRQLLDFGGRADAAPRPVELGELVGEWLTLLDRTLPEDIVATRQISGGPHWVNADPVRMEQAALNLALNARDAMPDGGELEFRLSSLEVGPELAAPVHGMAAGRWVLVEVADTGTGIAPEHLGRVWEPFFTTKSPGFGTGLGLSQVHGIVKRHDGVVDVVSELSVGTTILLYLPRIDPPPWSADVASGGD